MLRIGITGGIGSGKSIVCRIFESLHIPVYYADIRAKELMTSNERIRKRLIEAFGNQTYFPDNTLNRTWLAGQVFSDREKLVTLNQIVHPELWEDARQWSMNWTGKPYVIQEAAILIESGGHRHMDQVVLVYADRETRIRRTILRDGSSRQEVEARMQYQMAEEEKKEVANVVIYNNDGDELIPQVYAFHKKIINSRA